MYIVLQISELSLKFFFLLFSVAIVAQGRRAQPKLPTAACGAALPHMSIAAKLTAGNLPDNALAFTNRIYVPPGTFSSSPIRVQVRGFPFFAEAHLRSEVNNFE